MISLCDALLNTVRSYTRDFLFNSLSSPVQLGLFGRTFLLLATLMLITLSAWLEVFFSMELNPRANQVARRISTAHHLTHNALIASPADAREKLLLNLFAHENIKVFARTLNDHVEPLPQDAYWQRIAQDLQKELGPQLQLAWSVNQMPGFWVSFDMDKQAFWLVFERDQVNLKENIEWLGWGTTALLLSLLSAAISVSFVNRPLSRLAKAAQALARDEKFSPLPEDRGPRRIRELNQSFNRMTYELQQAETDREVMLVGISHDLRTPLARMRLEIELSLVSASTRAAIDQDLAQIDYSINQLAEYARPASELPQFPINVSNLLIELLQTQYPNFNASQGAWQLNIAPDIWGRISPLDLKRIVVNLIENACQHGRSSDGQSYLLVSLCQENQIIAFEVSDRGAGVAHQDVDRLLRPFARGNTARTGGHSAGLGLAIVKRLLKPIGGLLKILSRPGGGLVARVEWPLNEKI